MPDQSLIRQWLTQLGRLTSAKIEAEEVANYLDAFTPMLAERFDDSAFSVKSLEHVAAQCRYLPTYGELVPLLTTWVRQHRETQRMLALPAPAPEAREPYVPPPAPEWCFEREPRLMGRREPGELKIPPPLRTVEEQIAILNETTLVPA